MQLISLPTLPASSPTRLPMPLASVIRNAPTGAVSSSGRGQIAQPSNFNQSSSPARLGPWWLEAAISEGRCSRVYRAVKADGDAATTSGSARYAIKVLHEHCWSDPLALSRLRTEATVGRCVMHPHVVPVVGAHIHRPPYYVVMPLLAGANVAAALTAHGRFDAAFALWVARQIAEGLEALHTLAYVHGDVKPANILVSPDGHATLLDLGCARRAEAEPHFDDRPRLGAIAVLAPELLVGQGATPRSDLYSLGLAMFQMLAGRLPWRGSDAGVIAAWKKSGPTVEVREFAPGVPAAVSRFIRSLMAVEPLRRPTSARQAANELVRLEIATLTQRLPVD